MLKSSRSAQFLLPVVILAAVALSACTLTTQSTNTPSVSPTSLTNQTPMTNPVASASSEPDETLTTQQTAQGTAYSQTVFYDNPAGGDEVGFKMTLDATGTIIDADAEVKAVHQASQGLQNNFKAEVKQAVVGKKIADLQPDRIGGASLTTGAFRQFLETVARQS